MPSSFQKNPVRFRLNAGASAAKFKSASRIPAKVLLPNSSRFFLSDSHRPIAHAPAGMEDSASDSQLSAISLNRTAVLCSLTVKAGGKEQLLSFNCPSRQLNPEKNRSGRWLRFPCRE